MSGLTGSQREAWLRERLKKATRWTAPMLLDVVRRRDAGESLRSIGESTPDGGEPVTYARVRQVEREARLLLLASGVLRQPDTAADVSRRSETEEATDD